MKVVITKNELQGYMEVIDQAIRPTMGEAEYVLFQTTFQAQLKEGFKSGAVSVSLNKKLNMVYTIDEKFVVKMLGLYSKYLAVVIPQVMSIIKLTENLMCDIAEASLEFEEDDEDEKTEE